MPESKSPGQQMIVNLQYMTRHCYTEEDLDRAFKELYAYVTNLEKQYSKALHESGSHC